MKKLDSAFNCSTVVVVFTESSAALVTIAFKMTKNLAGGDSVCTSLFILSSSCELISVGCLTLKIILYSIKVYLNSKIINKICIGNRNACTKYGC